MIDKLSNLRIGGVVNDGTGWIKGASWPVGMTLGKAVANIEPRPNGVLVMFPGAESAVVLFNDLPAEKKL